MVGMNIEVLSESDKWYIMWLKTLCTQVLPHEFKFLFFSSQQTHHQPGSSSHQQGESRAAASACGHPGHLWTVFQRLPGRRRAHSSLLFSMVNGLTWFVILLLISSLSFFSSGRRFRTGRWPDVPTVEKCKILCPPAFVWGVKRLTVLLIISMFLLFVSALLLAGGTPGRGAFSASCSSLFLLPPRQDLWWAFVCVYLSFCLFKGPMVIMVPHYVHCQVGTWKPAQDSKGIYVSWVLLILLTVFTVARTIFWTCMKISNPISNIT